jgi:hypothetical protein
MPWDTGRAMSGSQAITITVGDSANGTGQALRVVTVAN